MRTKSLIQLAVGALFLCFSVTALADVIRWHFSATTFYDGTTVTGYFDYDTVSKQIVSRNFDTQDGDLPHITYNDQNNLNLASIQTIDTENKFIFESELIFQIPRVDVNGDGTKLVDRTLEVINPDSTNIVLDLSQPVTYVLQPLDGSFGNEAIRTYNYTSSGTFIDSQLTYRYINAVTLVPEILTSDTDGDGIPNSQDACPDQNAAGLDANHDGCIDSLSDMSTTLTTLVDSGAIDTTMQNSLLSKLDNATSSSNHDSICAAVDQVEAFKDQIAAQRGKKISDDAADTLTAYANNVIASLESNLPAGDSCGGSSTGIWDIMIWDQDNWS